MDLIEFMKRNKKVLYYLNIISWKKVNKIIENNENVLYATIIKFSFLPSLKKKTTGIFVVTSKRIIVYCIQFTIIKHLYIKHIESVEETTNFINQKTIVLKGLNEIYNIYCSVSESKKILEAIHKLRESFLVNKTIINNQEDYISQIERLSELRNKGIITDEEFTEKKRKLLL